MAVSLQELCTRSPLPPRLDLPPPSHRNNGFLDKHLSRRLLGGLAFIKQNTSLDFSFGFILSTRYVPKNKFFECTPQHVYLRRLRPCYQLFRLPFC
jgi:hypothetical protein